MFELVIADIAANARDAAMPAGGSLHHRNRYLNTSSSDEAARLIDHPPSSTTELAEPLLPSYV